jgi:hypothetical protein
VRHLRPGLSIRLACAALLALTPQKLAAQFVRNTPATDHLNVYLECGGRGYDFGFYQEQLQWVRWVTEPANADVVAALFGSKRLQVEECSGASLCLRQTTSWGPRLLGRLLGGTRRSREIRAGDRRCLPGSCDC